jgi:hypothetical protein
MLTDENILDFTYILPFFVRVKAKEASNKVS